MPIEIITKEDQLQQAGFYWRAGEHGVQALICRELEQDGFTNGFSTRAGGTSPMPDNALNLAGFDRDTASNINENRRRFLTLFPGNWTLVTVWQVHGSETCVVKKTIDICGDTKHCDALTTRQTGLLLGIKTADCVPVLISDWRTGAVAAVHAGWRGSMASIATSTLERMHEEFGTEARNVRVAIGPAARGCCYEVGPAVIEALQQRFRNVEHLIEPTHDGHVRIDLQRANQELLIEANVPAERIHIAPLCTMCRTDLFFSHRQESNRSYQVGRLLAVIGKDEDRGRQ